MLATFRASSRSFGKAASVGGGLVVALLASLLPVLKLAALTAPSVLAEE